jgi:hypothetical protein
MRQPSSVCLGPHGRPRPAKPRPRDASHRLDQLSGDRMSVGRPDDATGPSTGGR